MKTIEKEDLFKKNDNCCGNHAEGEACGCGTKKHSMESDDNGCGCGHNHGGNQVMIGSMSGHTLGTISCYTVTTMPITEMNTNLSLKDISLSIKEAGGVPMQLKASLKDPSGTVIMNMLGFDIFRSESKETTETDETRVKVNILVLCDGVDQPFLRTKLEEIMSFYVNNAF